MESHQREWLKGSLDLMLLALFEEQPMYGYQIVKELRARSGEVLQLKEGTIYPALHRMEQAGLVEGYWQRRDDGVDRRYYRLTPKGQAALPERRAAWQQFMSVVAGVVKP
jgi:PadR family transcriptional regulator, regulatory protein PadR